MRTHAWPLGASAELEPSCRMAGRLGHPLLSRLAQELGVYLPVLSKQWAALDSTVLGRLKREIPGRIWESYVGHSAS